MDHSREFDRGRVADILEIQHRLSLYCRGADRADAELMASVYLDDAVDHHGSFHGSARDFVADFVGRVRRTGAPMMHHVTNLIVEFDGESATSEAYFLSFFRESAATRRVDSFAGRYLDSWVFRQGRWFISDRVVLHDFHSLGTSEPGRYFPKDHRSYRQGDFAPNDPVYG